MKSKMYCTLVFLGGLFSIVLFSMTVLGISPGEKKQVEIFGVSTLSGLRTVCPIVRLNFDGGNRVGSLTENDLQTQVELALRTAGIRVATQTEAENDIEIGFLSILVYGMQVEDLPLYVFYVNAVLEQIVHLLRDSNIRTCSAAWPHKAGVPLIVVGSLRVTQSVREEVANALNNFTNDYLAANAKETKLETPKKRLEDFRTKKKP